MIFYSVGFDSTIGSCFSSMVIATPVQASLLSSLITDDASENHDQLSKLLDEAEQVQKTFKKCSSDGTAMKELSFDAACMAEAAKQGTATLGHLKKLLVSCMLL